MYAIIWNSLLVIRKKTAWEKSVIGKITWEKIWSKKGKKLPEYVYWSIMLLQKACVRDAREKKGPTYAYTPLPWLNMQCIWRRLLHRLYLDITALGTALTGMIMDMVSIGFSVSICFYRLEVFFTTRRSSGIGTTSLNLLLSLLIAWDVLANRNVFSLFHYKWLY